MHFGRSWTTWTLISLRLGKPASRRNMSEAHPVAVWSHLAPSSGRRSWVTRLKVSILGACTTLRRWTLRIRLLKKSLVLKVRDATEQSTKKAKSCFDWFWCFWQKSFLVELGVINSYFFHLLIIYKYIFITQQPNSKESRNLKSPVYFKFFLHSYSWILQS